MPQLGVVAVELGDGVVQLDPVVVHLAANSSTSSCLISRMPGSGNGRLSAFQYDVDLAAHGGDGAEGGMLGVEQLLGGGEELALGVERLGGLARSARGSGSSDAEPGERDPQAAMVVRSRWAAVVVVAVSVRASARSRRLVLIGESSPGCRGSGEVGSEDRPARCAELAQAGDEPRPDPPADDGKGMTTTVTYTTIRRRPPWAGGWPTHGMGITDTSRRSPPPE